MLSMSIHQGIKPLPSQNPNVVGFLKTPCLFKIHQSSSFCKSTLVHRFHRLSVSAAVVAETPLPPVIDQEDEGNKIQKPKIVLKLIWMEKNIGLGLDQEIPGHGSIPLSPYFFWPRKDAWEPLWKASLGSLKKR